MDYRALAELLMFGFLGLSVLTLCVGFSVRMFVAPVVREVVDRFGSTRSEERSLLLARVDAFEERLEVIEDGLDRLTAAREFDRQLEGPKVG
jgi:hypothetical protein